MSLLGLLAPLAAEALRAVPPTANALNTSLELPQLVVTEPNFVDVAAAAAQVAAVALVAPVAASEDAVEIVEEIVEWDSVPLVAAIRRGDLEDVKLHFASIPNARVQADGMSLLYIAVFKQRESIVEFLLTRGASANERNEEDYDSPLILARRRGDAELIRLLLTPVHRLGSANLDASFANLLESPTAPCATALDCQDQECSICFCDVNPAEDASTAMVALEKCGHACCSGCMTAFLSARIADTNSLNLVPVIRCFVRGCEAAVSFRDFERFAPREASQLYQLRLTTAACRMIPEFSWCTKCESGGFIGAGQNGCRNITCDACAHAYCSDCREDAHVGISCAQKYEQIMSGDSFYTERMSSRAILKLTKPCPSCTAPTIRDGGCSHMTCKACSFAWCWFCSGAYTGRYTFGNKCPCG